MIIFDIRLGRFSILATRGMDRFKNYGVTRLRGEFIIDTPTISATFSDERKAAAPIEV
jgi:hypothetical protein